MSGDEIFAIVFLMFIALYSLAFATYFSNRKD